MADLLKEIKEHMPVVGSDGTHLGTVDHLDGDARIKLTKSDDDNNQHHFIPTNWVDHIDNHVHLKKNADETRQGWKADAASCASCSA